MDNFFTKIFRFFIRKFVDFYKKNCRFLQENLTVFVEKSDGL